MIPTQAEIDRISSMTPEEQRRESYDNFAEAAADAAHAQISEADLIDMIRCAYATQEAYEAAGCPGQFSRPTVQS